MILIYSEWHLIPRWPLRSIFAQFPVQLLNGLVSWGSPGEYSLIAWVFGDAFGVLSSQFWSTVGWSAADTHLKLAVCMGVTLHIVDLWQCCCTRCNPNVIQCILFMVVCMSRTWKCGLHHRVDSVIESSLREIIGSQNFAFIKFELKLLWDDNIWSQSISRKFSCSALTLWNY